MKETFQLNKFRTSSSKIGLAELLYVLNCLEPKSKKVKTEIANLLGFDWEDTFSEPPMLKDIPPTDILPPPLDEEKELSAPDEPPKQTEPFSIPLLKPAYTEESEIMREANFSEIELENSEGLSETDFNLLFGKPPHTALLKQKWFRGIMSVMLATGSPTKDVNFKAIEKKIASLSPISELPYIYRSTLNKGVQVVLDVSMAMQPFWRDEFELVNSLNRLIDVYKTQVFEFELNIEPFSEMIWNIGSTEEIQPEIPVLLVTNFGATIDSGLSKIRECEDLMHFLAQAATKKCEVAGLIPASEKDFPSDIKEFIPFSFVWDMETSPQKVYRIKR